MPLSPAAKESKEMPDATDIAIGIIDNIIATAEKKHQVRLERKVREIIESSVLAAVEDLALEEAVWYTGLGIIPDIPAIEDNHDIMAFIKEAENELTDILDETIADWEYPDTKDTRHRLSVVIADKVIRAIIKEAEEQADIICKEEKEAV